MAFVKLFVGTLLTSVVLLLPGVAAAQEAGTVTGVITSEASGDPIPGVNVLIEGTKQGAVTNASGVYEITEIEPGTYAVRASFVGYGDEVEEDVEVNAGEATVVDIVMQQGVAGLDEVVVVGYGTQQRADVTGAISSVSSEDLVGTSPSNIAEALRGRLPGVYATKDHGIPGGSVSVNIRGMGTTGNSDPLYVVDGLPVGGSLGNGMDPSNIESIEVLKDAAAAAIYGARAANGVVLITTKSGQAGAPEVSFNASYGRQEMPMELDMLNAQQWAEWQNDDLERGGQEPNFSRLDTLGEGTNWQDEAFQPAPMQEYRLSVSGGTDNSTYYLSGGYLNQQGIALDTGFERFAFRVNTDNQLSDKFSFGNHLSVSRIFQKRGRFDRTYGGIINLFRTSPVIPVYDAEGGYVGESDVNIPDIGGLNEVALAELEQRERNRWRIRGDVFANYSISESITLRQTFGINANFFNYTFFRPTYNIGGYSNNTAHLTREFEDNMNLTSETTLNYEDTFADVNNLSALAGFSVQRGHYEDVWTRGYDFPRNDPQVRVLDAASGQVRTNGGSSDWGLVSLFGRVNYNYDSKYLLSANLRADGSSRFSEGNRYGVFPSFSAGWRIGEEPFMDDVDAISNLKLRGSWGRLGNQNIGLFRYLTTLNLNQLYVLGTGQDVQAGAAPTTLANEDIRWETTVQTDVGLELGLFEDRISLVADYFVKDTKDMLVRLPIPEISGASGSPYTNVGEVRNAGLELGLTYTDALGDFTYNLSGNFSTARNEVVSLGGATPLYAAELQGERVIRTVEGGAIGAFFGHVTDGVFQTWDEVYAHAQQNQDPEGGRTAETAEQYTAPGDLRYEDVNGDGVINASDRTNIGDPFPDFHYGLTANLSYGGFDATVFLQGVQGGDIYNWGYRWRMAAGFEDFNKSADILDRWTGQGTSNTIPRSTVSDPNNNDRASDRWVEDGSYLRLKTLELGYNIGVGPIGDARVYLRGTNLLTFTGYRGMDPEVGGNINGGFRNVDRGQFPMSRVYTIGVQMDF